MSTTITKSHLLNVLVLFTLKIEIFDQFGSSVEINAGFDFVSVSLYTLTNNINKVFPLFCEIAHYPSFPDSEFTLLKDIFRQNLKINNEKSSYLASKAIRQNIFGSNHPYGSSITESDLDLLTRQDLVNFFQTRFSLHEVYITGKVDSGIMKMLAKKSIRISNCKSRPDSFSCFRISRS